LGRSLVQIQAMHIQQQCRKIQEDRKGVAELESFP
jgi:hypothetical protein